MRLLYTILVCLISFSSIQIHAQITYDGNGIESSVTTQSFTVPAGTDRLLVVTLCNSVTTVSLTYNGSPMTFASSSDVTPTGVDQIYYLPLGSGASITADIVVTDPNFARLMAGSFQGIDQTNTLGNVNGLFDTGSPTSTVITPSSPGNLVFSKIGSNGPLTPDPSLTNVANYVNALPPINYSGSADFLIATSATTTTSYTVGGIGSGHAVAEFNAVQPPPIPTLGEWGLISLTLSFLIIGIVAVRQRLISYS